MRSLLIALSLLLLIAQPSFDAEQVTRLNAYVSYHKADLYLGSGRVKLHYLKIKDYRAHVRLVVALPKGGIGSLETLEQMAGANFALAGINANFYDTSSTLPIGLLIKDGEVLNLNYGRRAAMYIDVFGGVSFANPRASVFLNIRGSELFEVAAVNRPPVGNGLFLYTPEYTIPIRANRAAKVLRIKEGRVISIFESSSIIPDRESTIVLASGSAKERLNKFTRGDSVKVLYALDPPSYLIREAISAGPMLLADGELALDPQGEGFEPEFVYSKAARSAIAVTSNNDLILLVALKGSGSAGLNLFELAQFLKQLDAKEAMALDGGGSSALVFRHGVAFRTIGSSRKIAAGLLVIPK